MKPIKPPRLKPGDTIGIAAPSYVIKPVRARKAMRALEARGFKVKLSRNVYSAAHGYAGTVEERAEDFNAMLADPEVKLLLFGGGEVCNEILPYVDYEAARANPKAMLSYSDGTTLLEAIHARTGLVTFYGASPRTFFDLNEYNWNAFRARLMDGGLEFEQSGAWKRLHSGSAEGTLTGGYLPNYAIMQNGGYFGLDRSRRYILFLEDSIDFSCPAVVSKYFAHLEQSGLFEVAGGLIFGHYSKDEQPLANDILSRIGERYDIPVVWNDDFGHGAYNAIFPIGIGARLDADALSFEFTESGVE